MRVFRVLSVAVFLFILIASVDVYGSGAAFGLKIETVKRQLQGHYTTVGISADKWNLPIDKFELKIVYDTSALSFVKVQTGDFLEKCGGWRMNYWATTIMPQGAHSPNGVIRILAFYDGETAYQNDTCFIPHIGEELAYLSFFVKNDRNLECEILPMRFYWEDCRDNMLYSRDDGIAYISESVMDFDSLDITEVDSFPTYRGAQAECLSMVYPGRVIAERGVDFRNGALEIICADYIDCTGDLNWNGIPNEIGDAGIFTNYLVNGYPTELPCADFNGDSSSGTIEDYVCSLRILNNSSCDSPDTIFLGTLTTRASDSSIRILTKCEIPIGAILLKLRDPGLGIIPQLDPSISNMDIKYAWRYDTLRILIYSLPYSYVVPSVVTQILTIQYSSQKPELIFASAAGYKGERINLTIQDVVAVEEERGINALPGNYALYQNYPNPFNISTEIRFALPTQSDWDMGIFNLAGQKVRAFCGTTKAGEVSINWDGADEMGQVVSTGVYFYRFRAGGYTESKKMILLK